MPDSAPPPLSGVCAVNRKNMTWHEQLRGWWFRFGGGICNQQVKEFAELVPVDGGRLDYSADAHFLLRYKSFKKGSAENGHPVYPAPPRPGKNGKLVEPGYCCSELPVTVNMLLAFLGPHRTIRHMNIGYEVIASEPELDMASCVGFDLDIKNKNPTVNCPTVSAVFSCAGWDQPIASLIHEHPYLDYVLPQLLTLLTYLYQLRGTPLDPPLTLRDFYVSSACKPYVEEQREAILTHGRLSFHVVVPRLMFQNQADRCAFKAACSQLLHNSLLATVDSSVYDKNSIIRLPGHTKFDGRPLMPYSRGGMYGDEREYDNHWDIPADVMLRHMWSFVPPDAERLFTDATLPRFAVKSAASQPKGLRCTGTRRVAAGEGDAARVDAVVAVYERFCKFSGLAFDRNDYAMTLHKPEEDGVDYHVYMRLLSGCTRVCPVGEVHTSNNAKLVVRRGARRRQRRR